MKVKDLISVISVGHIIITERGEKHSFNLEGIPKLLALYGENTVYLVTVPSANLLEIIVKRKERV